MIVLRFLEQTHFWFDEMLKVKSLFAVHEVFFSSFSIFKIFVCVFFEILYQPDIIICLWVTILLSFFFRYKTKDTIEFQIGVCQQVRVGLQATTESCPPLIRHISSHFTYPFAEESLQLLEACRPSVS